MDQRKYNIYFHTHTISGIIIAAVLYVIFFAGSFSFFRDDITAWQRGHSLAVESGRLRLNSLFDSLARHHELKGRNFDFYMAPQETSAYINMSASRDTTVSRPPTGATPRGRGKGDSAYFRFFFRDRFSGIYEDSYEMGEFLYRLHFLAQLNLVPVRLGMPFGYLLAGVVSFIFLFALITGLLLHWDKIRANFFLVRPWSKWKTVWTDIHTVLGVIGFPFQLIYAITGIILIANAALITPYTRFLFNGSQEKLYEQLLYNRTVEADYTYRPLGRHFDFDGFISEWQEKWPGNRISRLYIRNYGDQGMLISMETRPDPADRFSGSGLVELQVANEQITRLKSPVLEVSYVDRVKSLIYHLHFGDFGGRPLRIVFFVLGLTGCLVILSGIMIWLVARDKATTPRYKRVFNFWAANVFLATCLGMLPATAFTFIMLKVSDKITQTVIYHSFFYSWLILGLYLLAWRNLRIMNIHVLLISAVLCAAVPLANGFSTGLWLWKSPLQGANSIFFIDVLFLALSAASCFACLKVRRAPS